MCLQKGDLLQEEAGAIAISTKAGGLEVRGRIGEGKIKTMVDSRHPWSKAEEAWAKSIDGHAMGKIIVEM